MKLPIRASQSNINLLAWLGAVPSSYVKSKRREEAVLNREAKAKAGHAAGLNGKRAMERRARRQKVLSGG